MLQVANARAEAAAAEIQRLETVVSDLTSPMQEVQVGMLAFAILSLLHVRQLLQPQG